MENITLPTDDWFEEMEDGNVRLSWSTLAIPSNTAREIPVSTDAVGEVIEISDGEELDKVFPIRSNEAGKSQKKTDTRAKALFNDNYDDDDDDDSDLEITLVKKTPTKLFPEKHEIFVNVSQEHERCETTKVNNSTSTTVQDAPLYSKEHIVIPNWQNVYGITQLFDKKVAARINKYREKFSKEFNNFDQSIWKHMTENLQNDHTFCWKMQVKQMLYNIIQKSLPTQSRSNLIAVGSTVNGCGSFNSDMDLCLCLSCPSHPMQEEYDLHRSFAIKHLKKIQKILHKERDIIKSVRYIPAKVPILNIHFQPPYHTLEVDMNINNFAGIYNSFLLHHYSRIDDRFSSLCLLVKHWAKKKGILDACNGYFNSYSLILMVLHYLQCGLEIPVLPNMQFLYPDFFTNKELPQEMKLFDNLPRPLPEVPPNSQSVGELLINFFIYYHKFNFERDAISIRSGKTFPRHKLAENTDRFKIYIEEPFDGQNTARCVTSEENWEIILSVLEEAVKSFSYPNKPNLKNVI